MRARTLLTATALVGFFGQAAAAQEPPQGQVLVEALGCGACHAGVPGGDAIRQVAPPFGEGAAPLAPAYVFHYMADPQTVRPDIAPARMPRYELDERQRVALALFTANDPEMRGVDDALREAMGRHPDADRSAGAALFETLNCAGCHIHPEARPLATAPDLSLTGVRVRPGWLTGYLARPVTIRPAGTVPGNGDQMPDFRLNPAETASIAAYLTTLQGSDAARASVQTTAPLQGPDWTPQALSPFAMQKAATLLRARWSCLGCHQLGDDGGRIGPRLDGIAQRLLPAYVRALIADPAHLAPGTIMPASLEQPDRIDLIASYLLRREGEWTAGEPVPALPGLAALTDLPAPDLPPADAPATPTTPPTPAPTPTPATPTPGAALYAARCAPCHGVAGDGDGFNAPFLPVAPTVHSDSAAMSLRPDDTLYDGIHAGGWILGKSHRMPAFGASLDDGQKRALVAYIRTLCRCEGPAWSRDGRRGR